MRTKNKRRGQRKGVRFRLGICAAGLPALMAAFSTTTARGAYQFTSPDQTISESFTGWGGTSAPANWTLAGSAVFKGTGTGSSNAGGFYSFNGDSLGYLASTSAGLTTTWTAQFNNATGGLLDAIDIDFFGEQWRAANRTSFITVSYSLNGSSFTDLNTLRFDSLDSGGYSSTGGAAFNGNDPANRLQKTTTINGLSIADGSSFYLRWSYDGGGGSGARDGLAIDDLFITAHGGGGGPGDPDTAVAPSQGSYDFGRVMSGSNASFTVNKTAGAGKATYTLTGSGDLSSVSAQGAIAASQSSNATTFNVGANVGTRTGAIVVHNTAESSSGPGLGTDDPDDTANVTMQVLANRQIGQKAPSQGGSGDNPDSTIDFGRVMKGVTASGTGALTTTGADDQATRVTFLGGLQASFGPHSTSGLELMTVTPGDIAQFSSADSTLGLSGTVKYTTTGHKVANYIAFDTDVSKGNYMIGEGLAGETVQAAYVYAKADVFDHADPKFTATGNNTITLDFGTIDVGDAVGALPATITNGATVNDYIAGLERMASLDVLSGDTDVFSLDLDSVFPSLLAAGSTSTFHASIDSQHAPGTFNATYVLGFADDQTILGASTFTLTLNLTGTLVQSYVLGDLNGDGRVDFDDLNPFALALNDPSGYATQFPTLNSSVLGDINHDGRLDFDDLNPFADLLNNGSGSLSTFAMLSSLVTPPSASAVPEPGVGALVLLGLIPLARRGHRRSRQA
jgi:hypothetical protein